MPTTWIMFDDDMTSHGVIRRIREELARNSIGSESQAAKIYGKHPQQWLSRHMCGKTDWKLTDLQDFCAVVGLDYIYVATGIRTIASQPTGMYRDAA